MLTICYGTRPEHHKLLPIMKELLKRKKKFQVFRFSQHEFNGKEYKLPKDVNYINLSSTLWHINPTRLDEIVAANLCQYPFTDNHKDKPTSIMVQGDTTTAFASALHAFHNKIPLIHVEAGLRSGNIEAPFPEEFNRRAIDMMATYKFCPTIKDRLNLIDEMACSMSWVVGNTGLDGLTRYKVNPGGNVIVTLHRRENRDKYNDYLHEISNTAYLHKFLKFYFLLHPNPELHDIVYRILGDNKNIIIREPMPRSSTLSLLSKCSYVITDSGGLSEEACYFGIPTLVVRESTERFHDNMLCLGPLGNLSHSFRLMYGSRPNYLNKGCPFGDGTASKQIVDILIKEKVI